MGAHANFDLYLVTLTVFDFDHNLEFLNTVGKMFFNK